MIKSPMPLSEFIKFCHKIYERRLTHAAAGNVSMLWNDHIFITASGCSLDEVTEHNIVKVDIAGEVECHDHIQPSSELGVHRAIYQTSPQIRAVIHAHPTKATALSVAGYALEEPILSEIVMFLGPVPLVPYYLPGSEALSNALKQVFPLHHAAILANHGVIATGLTLTEAFHRLECIEVLAETLLITKLLGCQNNLSTEQVRDIFKHPAATVLPTLFSHS